MLSFRWGSCQLPDVTPCRRLWAETIHMCPGLLWARRSLPANRLVYHMDRRHHDPKRTLEETLEALRLNEVDSKPFMALDYVRDQSTPSRRRGRRVREQCSVRYIAFEDSLRCGQRDPRDRRLAPMKCRTSSLRVCIRRSGPIPFDYVE